MKVKCINDSNRPNEIEAKNWIQKDSIYTVEKKFKNFNGELAYQLKEIMPNKPYNGYLASRFDELDDLENLMEKEKEFTTQTLILN